MNNMIFYLKGLFIPIIVLILCPIFLAVLGLLGLNFSRIVILLVISLTLLYSAFKVSKFINSHGYLIGLIYGTIYSLFIFILSLFFNNSYSLNSLLYYLIIIVSSMIGAILGVQKKH